MNKPTKFEDLKPTELYRSAIEDFAIPVEDADKNKKTVLLAALTESGVRWQDYVAQHPEVAPEPVNVIKSTVDNSASLSIDDEGVNVIVAEERVYSAKDKLLVKMTRENPLYEVRGHRFTKEHPYALVSPEDANYIIGVEDGFRQALPSELEEFYG